jgi:hypothetical protein
MSDQSAEVVEFKSGDGLVSLRVALERDDIWGTQEQVAELYAAARQNIGQHLKNGYKTGELTEESRRTKIVRDASGRERRVMVYSLDAIIFVGYRVKSRRGTEFRIWATRVLRGELTGRSRATGIDANAIAAAVLNAINPQLQALHARVDEARAETVGLHARVAEAEQRYVEAEKRLELITSHLPVGACISARAWREIQSHWHRVAELEAELSVLLGNHDKPLALASALRSVCELIKDAAEYGRGLDQRLQDMPPAREWEVRRALAGREAVVRRNLAFARGARQLTLDVDDPNDYGFDDNYRFRRTRKRPPQ